MIFLHTCSTICDNPQLFVLDNTKSIFFNASYQMMYWAVPVFFMITGTLFLPKGKNVKAGVWISKYVKRILLALLFFAIPYAMLKIIITEGFNISILWKAVLDVLSDSGFGHLWYLYVLVGIYLIMPILKRFCDNASDGEMKLVLLTLFILDYCFPLVSHLIDFRIAFPSQLAYPVFYLLVGHWIFENRELIKRKLVGFVIVIIIFVICFLNFKCSVPKLWTQYDSPLIAILAVSIFSMFVSRDWKIRPWLWEMDRLCFAAYLIHPLFIQCTYRLLKITPVDFTIYPMMTLLFSIIFICMAFISAWIMRKIGFLRKNVL